MSESNLQGAEAQLREALVGICDVIETLGTLQAVSHELEESEWCQCVTPMELEAWEKAQKALAIPAVDWPHEIEQAQAWARVWKKAARNYRKQRDWWQERAWEELAERVKLEVKYGKPE